MSEYSSPIGGDAAQMPGGDAPPSDDRGGCGDSEFPVPTGRGEARRTIVRLAAPMAFAEIVEFIVLFGIIALMGRMGNQALYIRSVYLPIAFLFLGVTAAFSISTQVAAAISRGRERPHDVTVVAVSMARTWGVIGGGACLLIVLAAPALAAGLGVGPATRGEFIAFMRWTSLSELSVIGTVICTSSLRGFGHARDATVVALTCAVVDLGGVGLLGLYGGLGVYSVPVAGVLSGAVGLGLGIVLARRRGLLQHSSQRWDPAVIGYLTQIGIPVALTYVVIAFYGMAIVWDLGPIGVSSVAGFSTAFTVQSLVITPGIVLGSATAIVMNQQRGAGKATEFGATFSAGLQISVLVYVVLAVATWLGAGQIAHIVTSNPQIAEQATHYLSAVALTFLIQGPVLLALSVMEQIGGGFLAAGLNISYFLAVAVIGGVLARSASSAEPLYRTIAVANLAGVSVLVLARAFVRRQQGKSPVMAP